MYHFDVDQLPSEIEKTSFDHVVEGFLLDRRAQGISHKTIQLYNKELSYFKRFLDDKGVETIEEVTANVIRQYLEELSGHRSPAGCHIPYRIIKSLTYWWEAELDGDYTSPMHRKVRPPKLDKKLLEPVDLGDVCKMIDACVGPNAHRDRAVMYCLLDTGCRANEFVSMDIKDLDIDRGTIQVRYGKGNKERMVIIGKKSRKAIRSYLRRRKDNCSAMWITDDETRLSYWGLRQLVGWVRC